MRQLLRKFLEHLLGPQGYALKDTLAPPAGLRRTVENLRARGFRPKTVLDIGVGHGTPWLYEIFPDARLELFEPLEIFAQSLEQICAAYSATAHYCALGETSGTTTMLVDILHPTNSSLLKLTTEFERSRDRDGPQRRYESREITIRRLDEFGQFPEPVLLKMDVEGCEPSVLRGAGRVLEGVEVVVSEVSVVSRYSHGVTMGGFLELMESLGFAIIDIAELVPLRRGGPLAYIDAVFTKANSPFRF